METKAAAKFAPLLVRRAAEGLDVMRSKGILRSAVSAICG